MNHSLSHTQADIAQASADLARLRSFSGEPSEFWNAFLGSTSAIAGASHAVLAMQNADQTEIWKKLAQWPTHGPSDRFSVVFAKQLKELAEVCAQQGSLVHCLDGALSAEAKPYALGVRLQLPKSDDTCVAAFLVPSVMESQAREALVRLQLAADAPASYYLSQQTQEAKADVERFAATLDLMVQVNAEKRFLAAALAFCNGLASQHHCDRVSLGWHEKGFIRLQAISRTEKFERNMAAAKALVIAMEEALDQDEEIVWPAEEGSAQVTRDHGDYAREQALQFICSLPLRLDGNTVAVVTCERQTDPFTETELRQLRLSCDQAVRRLADLKRSDRWIGARAMASAREKLARFVGPERTLSKALCILASLALVTVLVARPNYRVQGRFILHSDEVAYVTAPFDGFIDSVQVRMSDDVEPQQVVLAMVQEDLLLDESAAVADLGRYTSEAEKARAANLLADMRIAEALAEQARARLELVRYRLEQSQLKAPFDGVIVEGDQRERIGAPVKQGEVLFKIARTNPLYAEAEVSESDIHEIKLGAAGQVAFASQPKLKFTIRVAQIEPAARPKGGENVFLVRCEFAGGHEQWWRPGMTGACKINTGKRSLVWILTHRTMDYLRMLLWW